MKNYSKVIVAIFMIIIVAIIANSIFSFVGNPFKLYSCKKQVDSYLKRKYPQTEFKTIDSTYNFTDESYSVEVEPLKNFIDRFNVNISKDGAMKDYYIETKFQNEIKSQISNIFNRQYKDFNVSVDVFLPKDYKYNKDDKYNSDINGLKIMINIKWEKEGISKKSFAENCVKINNKLNKIGIIADSCIYSCDDKIGNYNVSIYKSNIYGVNINMTPEEIINGSYVSYYRH